MRADAMIDIVRHLLALEAGESEGQKSLLGAAERVSDKMRMYPEQPAFASDSLELPSACPTRCGCTCRSALDRKDSERFLPAPLS